MATATTKASVHTVSVPASVTSPTAAAAHAIAHSNPSNQDILQVVNQSGKIVWNLSSAGVASTNPVSPTKDAILGKYEGATFAQAFTILDGSDFYQISNGGKVVFHIDKNGVAFTP